MDAVAPVDEMVKVLHLLEHPPAQLTPRQASTCRKAALLAIGDRINLVSGCVGRDVKEVRTWEYVSGATRHRMSGQQLRSLYLALKGQREESLGKGDAQSAQQGEEQEEQLAAAVVLLQQPQASAPHAPSAATSGAEDGCWRPGLLACLRVRVLARPLTC
jgi:hypothetical protein